MFDKEAYKLKLSEARLQAQRARRLINTHVYRGKIPRVTTLKCFICSKQAESYHHFDYGKPTEVVPTCQKCNCRLGKKQHSNLYQEAKSMKPDDLTNVHEALAAAAQSHEDNEQMIHVSLRIPEKVKEELTKLCERHGTTVSAFLRKCCEALVSDYIPRK